MQPTRKRALSRPLEKYLLNPQMRLGLRLGIAPPNFALLETTGRRTGLPRRTPVGNGLRKDTFWLVAEHGRRCDYVRNLLADPRVRVKVDHAWRAGVATLMPDDDGLARRRQLDEAQGRGGRIDGAIFRATATDPLTIRIDLEPSTTGTSHHDASVHAP
ncbi:MAG: nitroreductase/quinone reductase family protein [Streptosporangiaceae bacterium]